MSRGLRRVQLFKALGFRAPRIVVFVGSKLSRIAHRVEPLFLFGRV